MGTVSLTEIDVKIKVSEFRRMVREEILGALKSLRERRLSEAPEKKDLGDIWKADSGQVGVKVKMGGKDRIEYFDTQRQARKFKDQMLDDEGRAKPETKGK